MGKVCACGVAFSCETDATRPFMRINKGCTCTFQVDHFAQFLSVNLTERFKDWVVVGTDYSADPLRCPTRHPFVIQDVEVIDGKKRGFFQEKIFQIRVIYNVCVAFLIEYGLVFLHGWGIIGEGLRQRVRKTDMGERLASLFLEYHLLEYNPESFPLNTIEIRLWNSIFQR
ncbi:MAG: hypothetical protein KDK71_06625 [Chlamydiia bacterium]|nr:hypothetical protein [Chlamydiia bacterium]